MKNLNTYIIESFEENSEYEIIINILSDNKLKNFEAIAETIKDEVKELWNNALSEAEEMCYNEDELEAQAEEFFVPDVEDYIESAAGLNKENIEFARLLKTIDRTANKWFSKAIENACK